MLKKFAMLAAGLLAGQAVAATATVWSAADGKGTVPPYGLWYSYPVKATTTTSATLSTGGSDEQKLVAKVSLTDNESAAGMGFSFAKTGSIDLSAYKGVCLDYSATKPFRFDIMQGSISDYDYNGIKLAAKTTHGTAYVAFADLAQEGWGTPVAFDASDVEKFQFSYKSSIAADAKSTTNTISIYSVTLANSCTQHAPELTPNYKDYNGNAYPESILEGKIHEVNVAEAFVDADDDDLVVTVKIESETNSIKLVDSTAYNQNSIIKFTPTANPEGPATITITATDPTKKSATFTFILNTEDRENDPVARDFAIKVDEDDVYNSGLNNRLELMGSDADGDKLKLVIVDLPAHGTLDVDSKSTTFTYTPDENYNGDDSFTYKFVDLNNAESESDLGTCSITVNPVNDAPVVKVVTKSFVYEGKEYAFNDTLTVDEDFKAFSIQVPSANITVTDPDGASDFVAKATSSGVVKATYASVEDYYGIDISSIKDANGVAKISLALGDNEITVPTVICYVKVNPVVDAPVAVADEYDVYQDSLNKVDAKHGVIANDRNPDSVAVTAVLVYQAEHGKVTLAKDGSFTYDADADYKGSDAFAYALAYGESDTTDMVIVKLTVLYKNHAPTVVEGVLDTIGKRLTGITEDFTTAKTYKKDEILTWFEDDSDAVTKLKFTVRSDDSLLSPSMTATGALQIKSVKDACGEAEVIVTATDTKGAFTDLKIPASITCTNDKPVTVIAVDSTYIPEKGWEGLTIDLGKLIKDPDGDKLTFTVKSNVAFDREMKYEIKGDSLLITPLEKAAFVEGEVYYLVITGADSIGSTTARINLLVGEKSSAIAPVMASAKLNWQSAIQASRGAVTMMDMQGRVMWTRKLPVSESEVRAAAATVQGRKILKVNSQVYSIK